MACLTGIDSAEEGQEVRVHPSLTNLSLGQRLCDRKASTVEHKRGGRCIYSDELVAHAKWLLTQTLTMPAISRATGLSVEYVRALKDEHVRAHVKPKELVHAHPAEAHAASACQPETQRQDPDRL